MAADQRQRSTPRRVSSAIIVGVSLGALGVLGACSQVPDALNPVEWYKDTEDFLFGEDDVELAEEDAEDADETEKEIPGAEGSFPELSTVPERPSRIRAEDLSNLEEGLVPDRGRRAYAPAIQRQGEAQAMAAPPPPRVAQPPVAVEPLATTVTPMPTARPAPPPLPQVPRMTETAAARPAPKAPPPPAVAAPPAPSPTPMATPQTPAGRLPPANALLAGPIEPLGTVVVSSAGVEMTGGVWAPTLRTPPALQATPAEGTPAERLPPAVPGLTKTPIKLATIRFGDGSANLDDQDRQILREVQRLHTQRGGTLRVVGHASSRTRNMDPVRHKMVNFKVSADRAEVVAKALVALGVKAEDIAVDAVSDLEPLYYEIMPSGEAGNRRAVIYLDQ